MPTNYSSMEEQLYRKGMNSGYGEKLFRNYIKALFFAMRWQLKLVRIERDWNMSKAQIANAGDLIPGIINDLEKDSEVHYKYMVGDYEKYLRKHFPMGIVGTQKAINIIKSSAFKLPNKKLKLESWADGSSHFDATIIHPWKPNKTIPQREKNPLKKKKKKVIRESIPDYSGRTDSDIYWDVLDGKTKYSEYQLDALIDKSKEGHLILAAGRNWPNFNYEKGLDGLIEKDRTGEHIYQAGRKWKKFNYEKGLAALKKFGEGWSKGYYEGALRDWPKGIKETQEKIDKIKSSASKLPNKKLKLEACINKSNYIKNLRDKIIYG